MARSTRPSAPVGTALVRVDGSDDGALWACQTGCLTENETIRQTETT